MSRDGAGTYSLPNPPFVTGTVINSTVMNSNLSDIANALTQSLSKDGQTQPTNNLPMNGNKHTGVLATSGTVARTEYVASGALQDGSIVDSGVTAGTSTAYTTSLTPAISAYADKQLFRVVLDNATGPTPTINFNSVGAKKIYKNLAGTATQLAANDLPDNFVTILRYDTTLDSANGGFWVVNFPSLVQQLGYGSAGQAYVSTGSTMALTGILAQGTHTVSVPAGAMISRTTSGAAPGTTESTTNKVMQITLDFDQSTDEFGQFNIPMPKSWNEGTVTAIFGWTAASGSGDVVWGIQGLALSNDDAIDTAFGTAQTVTDTLTATGDLCITSATSAITIGNSPAAEDWVVFQVYRDADAGGDTLNADAKLLWVKILMNLDASTDA